MISAQNLVYSLQGRRLTDNVSLTFPGGEIVAILGPNGAGKSTLLRQLTGYLQPDSGECRLFNKPLNEWSITELAKHRAVMRQNSHMAFPFSVQEVIQMGRHPHRTGNQDNETAQIMALCDCQALANRDYRQLSGGEQQMLAMGRALMANPKILLLDEPSMGLAPILVKEIFNIIKDINAKGTTVLLVEQNARMALSIAHRAYVMETGNIVMSGTGKELSESEEIQKAYLGG